MRVALLFLLWTSVLSAEEVPFSLEWDAVAGSRGYVVQIRKDAGAPADFRVQENRLKAALPEGIYQARVAGLNKFGKPGEFSDWAALRLERKSQVSINLSRPADSAAEKKSEQKSEEKPEQKAQNTEQNPERPPLPQASGTGESILPAFVPGLRQIQRGQVRGYAIVGSLLFLGAHAYHQKILGDRIADSPFNRPITLFPVVAVSPAPLAGALYVRRQDQQQKYLRHQNNQRWLFGGMALIYGLQTVDAILWKNSSTTIRAAGGTIALEVRLP